MMMTDAVPIVSNGFISADHAIDYDAEYDKILKLRDEVLAGKNARLRPTQKLSPIASRASVSDGPNKNSIKPSAVLPSAPVHNGAIHLPSSQKTSDVVPTSQQPPLLKPVSSDFDPVLLTKGPALVREEALRKRRAIESSLRDQVNQKKKFSRQRLLEVERLPNFNVAQVLERAHSIVKPVRFADGKNANRAASSSESFDENDYYSSQMNSWTTEDASPKRQPSGKEDEISGVVAMDIDSAKADKQAVSQPQPQVDTAAAKKDEAAAQAARIAELEEKLRQATERNAALTRVQTPPREDGLIEEPEYSPPDVQQPTLGPTHVSVPQTDHEQPKEAAPRRSSQPLPPQSREYATRHDQPAPSPVHNDMRIVRNHITSPLAPQPARVSPLAVAKAPPVSQVRDIQQGERRASGVAAPEKPASARVSPNQPVQPLTSKKRRRRRGSGETGRNVVPRREANSPEAEVRIKEEPVSPQSRPMNLEAWRPPRTEEVRRPVYIDAVSPQRRASDVVALPARRTERIAKHAYGPDSGRSFTPTERRRTQRNGQTIEIRDEPDLRRVVGTKQIFMAPEPPQPYQTIVQPQSASQHFPDHPFSPAPRDPQHDPSRMVSVARAPPQPRIVVDQYGNRFVEAPAPQDRQMSVVPLLRLSEDERFREQPQRPSVIQHSSYENRYDEPHYAQRVPSPSSPRYIERIPPPTSPRYVQRVASPMSSQYARSAKDMHNGRYVEDRPVPRSDNVRVISHSDYQGGGRFDEFVRPQEPVSRLESVRPISQYDVPRVQSVRPGQDRPVSMRPVPVSYEASRLQSMQPEQDRFIDTRPRVSQYDIPREQFTRVQSVRPEPERIVSLGGRRDVIQRQPSIHPEEMYTRPQGVVIEERPRYSYVSESQRYMDDDGFNNRIVYSTPAASDRRAI